MKKIVGKLFFLLIALLAVFQLNAWAHSGRTDANGGHYNRKTGEYHYHNSGKTNTTTIPTEQRTDQIQDDRKSEIVYITRTGGKYHRDGCRYLKSRIEIAKKDAQEKGYAPCKVCRP